MTNDIFFLLGGVVITCFIGVLFTDSGEPTEVMKRITIAIEKFKEIRNEKAE